MKWSFKQSNHIGKNSSKNNIVINKLVLWLKRHKIKQNPKQNQKDI